MNRFSKTQRYLIDTVSALLKIDQASKRPRKTAQMVDEAVAEFFDSAFIYHRHSKRPELFGIVPLQRGNKIQLEGISEEKRTSEKIKLLRSYRRRILVGQSELEQLYDLIAVLKRAINLNEDRHFQIDSIMEKYVAERDVVTEVINDNSETVTTNRLILKEYRDRVINRSREGYWKDSKNIKKLNRNLLDEAGSEILIKISTSTNFGKKIYSILEKIEGYSTLITDIPGKEKPIYTFDIKGLDTDEWMEFIEIAITFLVYFEIEFGNYKRFKICPECESIFFEEREEQKKFCSSNCSAKYGKKKNIKIKCKESQNTSINNYYTTAGKFHEHHKKIGETQKRLPTPHLMNIELCLECNDYPAKGGRCPILYKNNKEIIDIYRQGKDEERRANCYERQSVWLKSKSIMILNLPASFFYKEYCLHCEHYQDTWKRNKVILIPKGKCRKIIDELKRLNPDWEPNIRDTY